MRVTRRQKEVLADLAFGKEAIKHGSYFECAGIVLCEVSLIERLGKIGLVRVEMVGESTFASLSARGAEVSAVAK